MIDSVLGMIETVTGQLVAHQFHALREEIDEKLSAAATLRSKTFPLSQKLPRYSGKM
jgi:hypothetical protein